MTPTTPKLNDDGTVTYWSVYQQRWIEHADSIPDRELAAHNAAERSAIMDHLARSSLSTIRRNGILMVEDSDGGAWIPSDEAQNDINSADDCDARAIEICATEPMRGTWKQ